MRIRRDLMYSGKLTVIGEMDSGELTVIGEMDYR